MTLKDPGVVSSFKLSEILECLGNIHIWVDSKSGVLSSIAHSENLKQHSVVSSQEADVYEFTIPSDANFILGSCRDIDNTF